MQFSTRLTACSGGDLERRSGQTLPIVASRSNWLLVVEDDGVVALDLMASIRQIDRTVMERFPAKKLAPRPHSTLTLASAQR